MKIVTQNEKQNAERDCQIEMTHKDEMILKRIIDNKYKTPRELLQQYIDQGYRMFPGRFRGAISGPRKEKITACNDCGCFRSLYRMDRYCRDEISGREVLVAIIDVCPRCGGFNVKPMRISEQEALDKKFIELKEHAAKRKVEKL